MWSLVRNGAGLSPQSSFSAPKEAKHTHIHQPNPPNSSQDLGPLGTPGRVTGSGCAHGADGPVVQGGHADVHPHDGMWWVRVEVFSCRHLPYALEMLYVDNIGGVREAEVRRSECIASYSVSTHMPLDLLIRAILPSSAQ